MTAGGAAAEVLGDGDAAPLADGDGEDDGDELAFGEDELVALAAGAAASLLAFSAWPEPPLPLGDGLALAEELA